MPDTIKVKPAQDGSWYWTRTAPNGEVVATSETYTRKADAKEAAEREAGDDAEVVSDAA